MVMQNPKYELAWVSVDRLKIDGDEPIDDPYSRVIDVDQSYASRLSTQDIEDNPIVIDRQGHILDGNHRAWQAKQLGMDMIPAYQPVKELTEAVDAGFITNYIKKHHDQNLHPDYQAYLNGFTSFELKNVPVASIKSELPKLDRAKVEQYKTMDFSKAPPIVLDGTTGFIIDGYHRVNVAKALGITTIPAYVGTKELKESQEPLDPEVEEFLNDLTPEDVGVDEVGDYRVHFEGFTDDCQSSRDYCRNPKKVFQEVFADFIRREHGQQPVASGMVGDEDYPILYSVFKNTVRKNVPLTPEKAYQIAYNKKKPWPTGSAEEQLIRSDFQLSDLYDRYVLKNTYENLELTEADALNYIGNCTDDDVIEHIFGDATGFAQAVDEYGDEFVLDDLVVKYNPEEDIHYFYYKS
jgi:hypothetical protein